MKAKSKNFTITVPETTKSNYNLSKKEFSLDRKKIIQADCLIPRMLKRKQ